MPDTDADDFFDEVFQVYPEGVILLEEEDGTTDVLRVRNSNFLPDVMVSLAYGLDQGDDPAQWGMPIALRPDHKVTYLGKALAAAESVAARRWFPEYLDLLVASLPFETCGVLPFIRAALALNAKRGEIGEDEVLAAILAAKQDWLARLNAARQAGRGPAFDRPGP